MSQFFSILMVIVMALSGICGSVGSIGMTEPVSVEVGFGLDGNFESALQGTPAEGIAAMIPALLEKLTLRAALDPQNPAAMQLELRADGSSLLSIALQQQEDGWALASDLLPGTAITVKQETLDQMMTQVSSSAAFNGVSIQDLLEKINLQAILPVVLSAGLQLQTGFEASFGEPETGAFTVDGVEYTQKSVSSLTLADVRDLLVNAAQTVLSDENVAAAFSLFGTQPPALSGLDFTANVPADADFTLARYAGDAGKTCLEVLLLQGDTGITFHAADTEETSTVTLLVHTWDDMGVDAILSVNKAEQSYDLDLSGAGYERKFHVKASLAPVTGGSDVNIYVTFQLDGGDPFTVRASLKLRNEAPVFDADETTKFIGLEKLMNPESEEAEELSASLVNSLKTGLIITAGKLLVLFPDLASMIDFGSLLPVTVTTETPEDGPVVVETEEATPADDPSAA